VTVLSSSADFVYGNTRLRARKSELLGADVYETLLGRDLEGIFDVLAGTVYRPEIEAVLAVSSDRRALHEVLRRHLARALEELRAFYEGGARELVDLLLSRFDLQNLLALLRGRVRGEPPEQVLANVIPIGELGDTAAQEIARQPELVQAVELLVAWRLPDAATARALADAWPEYERTEHLSALEHSLTLAHARRLASALRAMRSNAAPLRELVAREHDSVNMLIVLRLRFALQLDELSELPAPPQHGRFLPGGKIAAKTLEAALRRPTRAEAVATLAEAARREDWRSPLQRVGAGGAQPTLQRELEVSRVRWAVGLFLRGDPLGLDVPIAFTIAKENEVRNLRLIGEGTDGGLSAAALRAQLIIPSSAGRWAG
jgi:V/A-type H+/Na+-transporting ATPase subunit C